MTAPLARALRDDAMEAELVDRGWVTVPLLSPEEVQRLRTMYLRASEGGAHIPEGAWNPTYAEFSVIHGSPDFRREAFAIITEVVGAASAPLLADYRPLVANFVNKPAGSGVVPMHQNWAVVDESRFRSLSVWVALVDVTAENGAMQMLPGSHDAWRQPRGMWSYQSFDEVGDAVDGLLETVEVPAGHAVILDDALVHYSAPNVADADRLAIQMIAVPSAARALFPQQVGTVDDGIEVALWEVEEAFFFEFWHGDGDPAHGRVVDVVTLESPRIDAATFLERFVVGRPG